MNQQPPAPPSVASTPALARAISLELENEMKPRWSMSLLAGLALAGAAYAAHPPKIDIYKSPTCGCCGRWADHLKQQGFDVTTHLVSDVTRERARLGMPPGLSSCHTAVVRRYVIEGHVPAADIKRLLNDKPNALGLAVPGMPKGSPGMEDAHPVSYEVLLVQSNGSVRTFAQH